MDQVTARDVVAGMKDNFDAAAAKGVSAVLVYELAGDGGGVWTLDVQDGTLTVDEGIPSGKAAAATVKMAADDFVKVALGEMNPMQGFMSRKIKIQGDPFTAQQFQGFFKRPS
ncbi:MAG: SCP2 sterol-binding domain-containing protein [Firmicutes bacterium]|nr:SCP2 sterol-binding domain-containing protein [Bacillota bacterium]